GLLVPVRNVTELAKAIRYLLENGDLRTRMGLSGREIASREFSQEAVVQKTLELYNDSVKAPLDSTPEILHAR
ncbi:MAG TPA: hypothetical protein VLT16_07175, partial [Candidatus Limnocylindrales bacterium]|nr:hypothetical protein [Candidatus Limnocylindrales bacterium]